MGATERPSVPARDVLLRDGRAVRLSEPRRELDGPALVDFLARLSTQSLYRRFHGLPAVGPELAARLLASDGRDRLTLLAWLSLGGDERVVGVASWIRLRDETHAEVAFAVADELQGHGLGTRLLEQLAATAASAGVTGFVAWVLPDNGPMLSVFADAGFAVERSVAGGEVEVRFPIAPTAAYVAEVDRRDHRAVVASLEPVFRPASVAVVGASARRGTVGGELFRNIVAGGFAGRAYPVNRRGEAVAGVAGHASVAALPETPELVVACVPATSVEAVLEEAFTRGTRAACVISAGFAEVGQEGRARQDRLLALARRHGARLVGPNCLGVASLAGRLNATFARAAFPPGRIAFASQSGALGLAVLEAASSHELGLSAFVSVGNKADVSTNDLLEWWEDDDATDLVLLYVESFGNPRKFSRLARRVARRKPIVAMKAGRTAAGARAAGSHTAALASPDSSVDALFHQAGVVRVDTLEELLDTAALLATQPLPRGRRVAIVTNAGGLGILCADACAAAGLQLPPLAPATTAALAAGLPAEVALGNPVDLLGGATAERFEEAVELVLGDGGIDAVVVLFVPPAVAETGDVAAAIARAAAGATKPLLACLLTGGPSPPLVAGDRTVPTFAFPESAARVLARAVERTEWLARPLGGELVLPVDAGTGRSVVDAALAAADDTWLEPGQVATLLAAYGIPVLEAAVAATPDAAAAEAVRVGFPVCVKLAAAGVHKTERGGVALDLADAAQVRRAAARLGERVVVQPMIDRSVELIAGLVHDRTFGPVVAFGAGGVLSELIGEVCVALAPLTDVEAQELVTAGPVGALLRGYRGAVPRDIPALVELVGRLGRLGDDLPEVAELDLNPVMALPSGCVAVDARVRVRRPELLGSPKTW